MTEPKPDRERKTPEIEDLSVNKETVENLTAAEAEAVKGGLLAYTESGQTCNHYTTCQSVLRRAIC